MPRFYDPDNPYEAQNVESQYWLDRGVPVGCAKLMGMERIRGNVEATEFLHSLQNLVVTVVEAKETLESENRFIIKCRSQEQATEVAAHFTKAFGLKLTVDEHNRILLVNYPKMPSNLSRERFFKHVATAMSTYGRLLDTVSLLPGSGVKNGIASPSETNG